MKPLFQLAWTAIFWAACSVSGTEVDPQTAAAVAKVWLSQPRPMGTPIGSTIKAAIARKDSSGATLYHVINLQPEGFLVVAGDDGTEPIVAFSAHGQWTLNTGGPLTAMLDKDLGRRLAQARVKAAVVSPEIKAKWKSLNPPAPSAKGPSAQVRATATTSVSDVRVAPLLTSQWSQTCNLVGAACFNYFTPPHGDGNANNYPCGCVATAMAQVLRYFQFPTTGVGTGSHPITVDGVTQTKNLRGGDGSGGAYRWDLMPLTSNSSDTNQNGAIGALLYDCGVAVSMDYTASGSGAFGTDACAALGSIFKYKNSVNTSRFYGGNVSGTNLYTIVNPNLDSGSPVMFSIEDSSSGHEVVCDGYGYNSGTIYHHVNLGWQGTADAWYNLPTINTGAGITFTIIDDCSYNIFTNATGEIISGRVLDIHGNPISGVTVTATAGTSTVTATTSAQGIYGLIGAASGTTYSVSAGQTGYGTQTATAKTGTSKSSSCGNVWGCNFTLGPAGVAQVKPAIVTSPSAATIVAGGSATLSVSATGDLLTYQWSKNGVKIGGATSTNYTIASASVSDAGTYTATAANSLGTATSKGALVAVVSAPSITTQPGVHYARIGGSFTLSVTASGGGLNYQWSKDGANVGSNSAKYTVANAQANDSGTYLVLITNIAGSVTSNPTLLTVLNPPAIAKAPAGGACPLGSNMTLSVRATGDQLAYQWKKGSAPISGATGTNYTITAAQKTDAGTYSVVVSNALLSVSGSAAVTVVAPPAVNAAASSVTLMPGLTLTLKTTATGTGPFGYRWSLNGTTLAGAITNVYMITNASSSSTGTYVLTVTNFGGTAQASIAAGWSADITPPTFSLSSPVGTVTNAAITLAGKAADNVAVSNISYSLNGSNWVSAVTTNHWTNWSAPITLGKLGTNALLICATDINSNTAAILTNYPVYAPMYNATVNVTGLGKVTTSWKGSQIQYGKTYTATAVNGPAYVLKNWTGDIATNQPSLSFVAASNLILAANFVPNLFTNSGGAYNGLFIGTNGASHTNTGFLSGSITTNLTYSSKVLLEGQTVSFSGRFNTDGTLVQSVTRNGKSPLQLNLVMNFANNQLAGTISADDWVSALTADLAVYSSKNTTTNAGAFTFVFPVSAPDLGYGGGQVIVSTNGVITLVGNAPDGTSLSQSVPLAKDGYWPLFVPIYGKGSTNLGEVYGWLNFTNGTPSGNVVWYRPAGISPYVNGFLETNAVQSSVFTVPTKQAPKELSFSYGSIQFTGGGISAPFSEIFLVANDGSIYTQGASTLKINPKGQVSGSVTDPVNGGSATLVGTILQSSNTGKGSILGTNQLGAFTISVSP